MNKLPIVLLILMAFSNNGFSQNQIRIEKLLEVVNEIKILADEFNLTSEQKRQIKSVLLNYLPNLATNANFMINNRRQLMASNLITSPENEGNREEYMLEIASQQGQLLTNIIISKEHMKKDIRKLLTQEQQSFVEDLISTIVQYRINNS